MQNVQRQPAELDAAGNFGCGAAVSSGIAPVAADWRAWYEDRRSRFEAALVKRLEVLETGITPHSRLGAAVAYSVRVGGKRLRPILVLEACRVCGGDENLAEPAAAAVELLHTYSLIHDDLPAMDDDDLRRGQPTNHKVFGEAQAILAGDWLATYALELLATAPLPAERSLRLVRALAAGTLRMIEGQAADVEGEQRPVDRSLVEYIHRHKTAALIEACCRLGAIAAGASDEVEGDLATYGRHLGLAFQVADDLLDEHGTVEQMGKRVGKDAGANKQTYPAAFGLAESEAAARGEVVAALAALERFDGRADRLRDLARYVIGRSH